MNYFKLLIVFLFVPVLSLQAQPEISFEPYLFITQNKDSLKLEQGNLQVPENRAKENSREIELSFVRFDATTKKPGSPIIYLAGGPGGSGITTARGERFPLFKSFRQAADVIAFDQRGTGQSNTIPRCGVSAQIPLDKPGSYDLYINHMKRATQKCIEEWDKKGIDLNGYTTLQSAEDLEALRKALGTEKITLWGISYGTHLALAYAKYYPNKVDKMVLASVEDLNETVKRPALTDQYLNRLNNYLKKDPSYKRYGNLLDLMDEVLTRLENDPITETITVRDGKKAEVGIGRLDVQLLTTAFLIKNPGSAIKIPYIFQNMKEGDFSQVANQIARIRQYAGLVRGMPLAMDCSSGITSERWEQVQKEAVHAIMGRTVSFPLPDLCMSLPIKDLGNKFRSHFKSSIPTLILSGTLDGRTYIESTKDLMENFQRARQVILEGAGHDLFMSSPEVETVILDFLRGNDVAVDTIKVDVPPFVSFKRK